MIGLNLGDLWVNGAIINSPVVLTCPGSAGVDRGKQALSDPSPPTATPILLHLLGAPARRPRNDVGYHADIAAKGVPARVQTGKL